MNHDDWKAARLRILAFTQNREPLDGLDRLRRTGEIDSRFVRDLYAEGLSISLVFAHLIPRGRTSCAFGESFSR